MTDEQRIVLRRRTASAAELWPPPTSDPGADVVSAIEAFALAALRIALWTAVAMTVLGLLSAGSSGSVEHSWSGGLMLVAWIAAALSPRTVATWLRPPGRTIWLALATTVWIDLLGADGNPFLVVSFVVTGIAVIVESRTVVVACVALLVAGYLVGVFAQGYSPAQLLRPPLLGRAANDCGDVIIVAALLSAAIGACQRVLAHAPEIVERVRTGGAAVTEPLGRALRRADRPAAATLPPAWARDIVARLSERERSLLLELARGRAPKEVAFDTATPLETIRSQLAAAKRKTGARTLEQLVGWVAEVERL